ncbi:hypothetical protein QAD02_018816 [Eretmocerus hayati]|uniref:Uncharacterized protein n=1 Tax=Eretmocerus hayati TaxID=131215 RepID=A0ACC2PI90_9HYME|nr:hypothetical protein QAD02_018816 [Eretmocerus hayati]
MADQAAAPAALPQKRQLRERTRKLYIDDWAFGEDEFEGRRGFQLEDKIENEKYSASGIEGFYQEMNGSDLTVSYFQEHGLTIPLLIKEKTGLGIRVPSSNFDVNDVRTCVGSRRMVDVMDVNTQKGEEMTMKEWQKYFEDPNKLRLLNVISLEFSHTKLENYVQSPTIVRQVDWVDSVWPKHLKDLQVESTNSLDDMMYPKVQKYCLMSVKGCYTDFHVDFGGTSVWYHILKGGKIFWLIPPTEKNLAKYENWVLSGKQSDHFFGDMVDCCKRITLSSGMTMFIPSGWIHAVYTPEDSLVFGGNFLHSFGIEKQLKVAQVEERTKVPHKFRYPFYTEMLWYVLERYVHVLLGRSHLDLPESQNQHIVPDNSKHTHLTSLELHGLKSIVMYLHSLAPTKKNVPELIKDPVALIQDVRCLVEQHRHDSPELAVTGQPVLPPPPVLAIGDGEKLFKKRAYRPSHNGRSDVKPSGPRRRRTRCKKCEACTRTDCAECVYCLDMVKFGGSGRAKQTCLMRQCLRPNLPATASCKYCGLDGWGQMPGPLCGKPAPTVPSSLMECSVCFEIVHPKCTNQDLEDIPISDDLPNSWECPNCCESGRNLDSKSRAFKARARKISTASSYQATESESATTPSKSMKLESNESWSDQSVTEAPPKAIFQNHSEDETEDAHMENGENECSNSFSMESVSHRRLNNGPQKPYALDKKVILPVLKYLSKSDLVSCACVCKTWSELCSDPSLWRVINLSHNALTASHLSGIVRHQPETLILDWTNISKKQLAWLLNGLFQLKHLSLKGCNWSGICALSTSACPELDTLDLSFAADFKDLCLREILCPPQDSGPSLTPASKLKQLKSLSLRGCELTDVALRYIAQYLPQIRKLNLSACTRITDAGIAQLTLPPSVCSSTLVSLNLAGCSQLTDTSLEYLTKCSSLKHLDLRNTVQISRQKIPLFTVKSTVVSLFMDNEKPSEQSKENFYLKHASEDIRTKTTNSLQHLSMIKENIEWRS